ncbi:Papilin Precursor [Takifugu flavidus]|uniref:Papilin n=1 Tax=Takifugu flavidus TaxID=433684 RepID=A0A5C6P3A4_9TELE|nr:Papilin Precursor [Takifugu flavidus]
MIKTQLSVHQNKERKQRGGRKREPDRRLPVRTPLGPSAPSRTALPSSAQSRGEKPADGRTAAAAAARFFRQEPQNSVSNPAEEGGEEEGGAEEEGGRRRGGRRRGGRRRGGRRRRRKEEEKEEKRKEEKKKEKKRKEKRKEEKEEKKKEKKRKEKKKEEKRKEEGQDEKMLLLLLTLQLLLPPVVLVTPKPFKSHFVTRQRFKTQSFQQIPSSDYWDSWGPYGECSRSCGSGVTTRTRRCITSRLEDVLVSETSAASRADGGHNCVGPDKSFRLCNIQECPEGSSDFREDQCSQFDGTDFQGKRYKWLPYYGADNPCELNCSPRGENFFYRHRSAVADGTPCRPGRRDICVDGACKRLGCDNMLESSQQEDPCLQCGGAGQSCYRVHNSFSLQDLQTGYNQMFIIPVGATTISIRETVATRNYLAIKNLRGEYYLNGHWVIDFSRATPIAGTTLYYQRGAEGDNIPESITGRGPTTEPLVVELISQELNQGVEYDYYLPRGRSREGYYWSLGSWSSCSSECGSGYQSRLVFCTIDNEAYPDYLCASLQRPQSNRTCNPHPCPQTRRMAYLYPPQLWKSSERPRAYVLR